MIDGSSLMSKNDCYNPNINCATSENYNSKDLRAKTKLQSEQKAC